MVTFGARTRVFNCSFEDNYYWGLSLGASDGTMRNHIIANCTFTGNSAGKDPTGSTGTEPLVGVNTNTVVFGCHFYDNDTTDHHLYRGWSGKENDRSQGLARIHDNIFDGTVGTASGSPIGCKGRGARVFRNKLYKTGGQGIAASIGSAPDGGTPFNLTYSHHNLVLDLDNSHEAGGLVLTALALKDANGRGAVHHWNNTVDVGQRGAIITRNKMSVDGNTFTMRNNLISRQQSHAVELRTVVEFVDIDYNYYYDYNDSFRVNGKRKTDAQWQGHGYDLNSRMDAANPQFEDFARAALTSRDYNLKPTSPARGTGTDAVQLVDTDPDAWIGINYVPHATTPDAGAYQYLSAKTLDFSRYFAGLRCKNDLAHRFKLWRTAQKASGLRALTSA